MMEPYMVESVLTPGGMVLRQASPAKWREVTTPQRAALIQGYMENVVENGTGSAAAVDGIKVAGKTGTAENPAGADHGWFIGSAQLPNRTIAFGIIVENSGGGGSTAAPIARRIIQELLNR